MPFTNDLQKKRPRTVVLRQREREHTPHSSSVLPLEPEVVMTREDRLLDFPKKQFRADQPKGFWGGRMLVLAALFFLLLGALGILGIVQVGKSFANKSEETIRDFDTALTLVRGKQFEEATASFAAAREHIRTLQELSAPFLSAGEEESLQEIFVSLEQAISLLESLGTHVESGEAAFRALLAGDGKPLLAFAQELRGDVHRAQVLLSDAERELKLLLDAQVFSPWEEDLKIWYDLVVRAREEVEKTDELLAALPVLLGEHRVTHTAIFFQNSGELRATGGFPGSMAIVMADRGELTFTFHDIYEFEWSNGTQIPPAPGFERLTDRLKLQDGNLYLDANLSADSLRDLLEKSGGPTVEQVVFVNDQIFSDLLRLIGPLDLPYSEEQLTPQNASFLLSFFVEGKMSGKHSPKDILKELLPAIHERAQELSPQDLLAFLEQSKAEKTVMASSSNARVQAAIERFGLSGTAQALDGMDYLAVVSANVGGNKSDHVVAEHLDLTTTLPLTAPAHNTLTITRTHLWGTEEEDLFDRLFAEYGSESLVQADLLRKILGKGDNHSYTKVYVPKGSVLLKTSGVPREEVQITTEGELTVFAFRFPTLRLGAEASVTLHYALPEQTFAPRSANLSFQAQSGRKHFSFDRQVLVERGLDIISGEYGRMTGQGDTIFLTEIR